MVEIPSHRHTPSWELQVGHETESIYKRYAIQDETMLREGAAKLDAWATAQAAQPQEKKGEVRPFPKTANG